MGYGHHSLHLGKKNMGILDLTAEIDTWKPKSNKRTQVTSDMQHHTLANSRNKVLCTDKAFKQLDMQKCTQATQVYIKTTRLSMPAILTTITESASVSPSDCPKSTEPSSSLKSKSLETSLEATPFSTSSKTMPSFDSSLLPTSSSHSSKIQAA